MGANLESSLDSEDEDKNDEDNDLDGVDDAHVDKEKQDQSCYYCYYWLVQLS